MRTLKSAGLRRHPRSLLTLVVALLAAAALVAAFAVSPGGAVPRVVAPPQPITLTFVGQVTMDQWGNWILSDPSPYPPVEGGYVLEYTVPDGNRLVIESLYANVYEEFWPLDDPPTLRNPRADVVVGVDTFYDLGTCDYPGYQRSYDVPLVTELTMAGAYEGRRAGSLQGPIYVEGGRVITGAVMAPGGNSTMYVHIVAHGRIEPSSTNPTPPTCLTDQSEQ